MTEFLAEADVLIRPNTAGFRQTLIAELTAATRGLKVTIPTVAIAGAQKAATATQANAVANAKVATTAKAATVATKEQAAAEAQNLAMQKAAAKAALEHALAEEQKKIQLTETAALQKQAAAAARAETVADKQAATAAKQRAAAEAAKNAQLARGGAATGLQLLGARGATLAAGSEFLIGAAAVTLLAKAVQGASEDEETLFGVSKVLGNELGNKLAASARTLATSYGIADDQALKFEGALAATLKNAGFTADKNAELSQSLVKVAADLGAVRHVPVEQTLKGIQLAVSGNTRSLRQYGIVIQNSEVQQRALTQTGKDSVDQLTRQELTVARISLIFDRAAFAAGGFQQNAGSLANQSKILTANMDRLGDMLGHIIIPFLTDAAKQANTLIDSFVRLKEFAGAKIPGGGLVETVLGKAHDLGLFVSLMGPVGAEIKTVKFAIDQLTGSEAKARDTSTTLDLALNGLQATLTGVGNAAQFAGINLNALRFDIASNAVAALGEHLTQLDIVGATSAQKIAALQKQAAEAQTAVRTAPTVAARRSAREQRAAAINEIRSIRAADTARREQAASEAKSAASKAKSDAEAAAREAQAALDAQDQALLTNQQFAQTDLQIAAVRAQHTKSLVDDLAVLRRQLALTEQQIVEARKIHDATLRRQTIQQLTQDAEQTRLSIQQTKEQQLQNIRQRKVDAAEAAVQSAQLDAELADTLKKPKAQIAALERENRALEAERKLWVGNTLKQKEIRNQIAQNNAAIKELKKETDTRNTLSFELLQTQAGFAATLLSNLLPTSAVAGTVGGGAISTPAGSGDIFGPGGFATAAHDRPGKDLSSAVQAKAAGRGATQSQMSAVISILRQSLNVQLRLVGQRTHPEATHQRVATGEAGHYF